MKRYIKSIESIDTSSAVFEKGTRWVDIERHTKFTITKVDGDRIYTDGFYALLSPTDFKRLLENKSVRPTEDYFLVSSGDEFLGYLSKYEIVNEDPTNYLLHISKQEICRYTGMSITAIQDLIRDLTLWSTNYKYVSNNDILELVDLKIDYREK